MKTDIKIFFGAAVLLAGLCSCSESWTPPTTTEGTLALASLSLEVDDDINIVTANPGRADGEIDVNPFLVTVTDAGGAVKWEGTYGDKPEVIYLPAADGYKLTVRSHVLEKVAWDKPYYFGEKAFDVKPQKITDLGAVVCKFSSLKVSVRFSDEVKGKFGDDVEVTVMASESGTSAVFTKEDVSAGRAAYFDISGVTTMAVSFYGHVDGALTSFDKSYTGIEAGQHHIITFGLNENPNIPSQSGSASGSGISLDISVDEGGDIPGNVTIIDDTIDDGDRPGGSGGGQGPDDPNPPTPGDDNFTVTPTGIDLDGVVEAQDGVEYKLHITSVNPLTNMKVDIVSDYLTDDFLRSVGLCASFDLAEPGQYREALEGFEFPVGENIIGHTEVDFVLTPFIPLLKLAPEPMVHTFKLTLIDNQGNSEIYNLRFHSQPE